MIEYATREDILRLSSNMRLTEQASVRKAAEERDSNGATFLSHSSKDQVLVVGAVALLAEHGASVYIDKKDPALPPYTSAETAIGLKKRIRQSRNFVLLASENSKDSRWVPWELGIADQAKNLFRVAILPTVGCFDRRRLQWRLGWCACWLQLANGQQLRWWHRSRR